MSRTSRTKQQIPFSNLSNKRFGISLFACIPERDGVQVVGTPSLTRASTALISSPCLSPLSGSISHNPVRLELNTLTFYVDSDGDLLLESLPDFMLEIFEYATNRISTLHRASTVKELAIHVTSTVSVPSASLALHLIKNNHFLDRFRSLHLDRRVPSKVQLHVQLPPRAEPRGVVIQGTVLASDNFVFEESYQQQVQYYSEGKWACALQRGTCGTDPAIGNAGNVLRSATENESDSVVALAVSPDKKSIVSGSRQQAILWHVMAGAEGHEFLEMVHEWIAPLDDDPFTRPFVFSSDSQVLACCTRDPGAFVQVRDVVTGKLLAAFRAPAQAVGGLDICRASCVWSPDSKTLTSVVSIPSQHQLLVQVWNAKNYRMVSATTETTSLHSPSFLCSPNGRWMACFQTARSHSSTSPPVSPTWEVGACTVLGAPLTNVPMDCHILSAVFDQTSTRFAAVSSDHILHVWSLSAGTKLLQVRMREYPNDSERLVLAFSPDGTKLLSCSGGRGAAFVLTVRDAASGRTLLPRRPAYHFLRTRTAPRFAFSNDGGHLLSASEDGSVQLWRAADASFVRDLARSGDAPTTFAWSEDGTVLAWGTKGGGVVVKPL